MAVATLGAFVVVTGVLGLLVHNAEEEFPEKALALLEERQAARKAKDFSRAVQIRDALKGQIANPVPPVEALAVMAVLEAAVRSAESGMVQTLDLSDNERNMLR